MELLWRMQKKKKKKKRIFTLSSHIIFEIQCVFSSGSEDAASWLSHVCTLCRDTFLQQKWPPPSTPPPGDFLPPPRGIGKLMVWTLVIALGCSGLPPQMMMSQCGGMRRGGGGRPKAAAGGREASRLHPAQRCMEARHGVHSLTVYSARCFVLVPYVLFISTEQLYLFGGGGVWLFLFTT